MSRQIDEIAARAGQAAPLLTLDTHGSGRAAPHQRLTPDSEAREIVGRLLSVNVGMPKNVPWQGKTVFTGVFKEAVAGPRRVGRLNIDGDGQGDLAGHGGEQRAVFVYQIDSYRYWQRELGRDGAAVGGAGRVGGTPEEVRRWLEASTALRLDASGAVAPLKLGEWEAVVGGR